ncbi:hypothetical protein ACJX0J_020927, partial [Zea mays]
MKKEYTWFMEQSKLSKNNIIYMLAGQKMMKPHKTALMHTTTFLIAHVEDFELFIYIVVLWLTTWQLWPNKQTRQAAVIGEMGEDTKIFIFGFWSPEAEGDSYVEEGYSESSFLFLKCFS